MVVVCESEWEKPGKPRSFFRQIHLPFFRQNAAAWLDRHRTSITYARTVGSGAASSLLLGSLLAGEAYRRMPHRAPAARERALCGACFVVSRALAGLGDSGGGAAGGGGVGGGAPALSCAVHVAATTACIGLPPFGSPYVFLHQNVTL